MDDLDGKSPSILIVDQLAQPVVKLPSPIDAGKKGILKVVIPFEENMQQAFPSSFLVFHPSSFIALPEAVAGSMAVWER